MSNRERNMLYILLAIIVAGLLYVFVFEPQQKRITELNEEIAVSEKLIKSVDDAANSIGEIETKLDELNENIKTTLSKYYKDIHQADVLALIDHFIDDNPGSVKSVNFIEGIPKDYFYGDFMLPQGYNVINAKVVYQGDFVDFIEFADYFYELENNMYVSFLESLVNEDTGEVETTVRFSFIIVDSDQIEPTELFEWTDIFVEVDDPFEVLGKKGFIENYKYLK